MSVELSSNKKEINLYKRLRVGDKVGRDACYELVFLLRSDMSNEDAKSLLEKVSLRITDSGGVLKNRFYWGLRTLRYKINRMKKAHFYCIHFTSSTATCDDISKFLRNNASILRFINIRMQFFPKDKSSILVNLEQDVQDGVVIYDEKYVPSAVN